MQDFLSLLDNALDNPGYEHFYLMFESGFVSNVIIGKVPEIELPICNFILLGINTDANDSIWFYDVLLKYDGCVWFLIVH